MPLDDAARPLCARDIAAKRPGREHDDDAEYDGIASDDVHRPLHVGAGQQLDKDGEVTPAVPRSHDATRGTIGHATATTPRASDIRPSASTASEPIAGLANHTTEVTAQTPSRIAKAPNSRTAMGRFTPGMSRANPNTMARLPRTAIIHAFRASASSVMGLSF
jgi:hypothetical protein